MILWVLAACRGAEVDPAPAHHTIVVLGSSTAAGMGPSSPEQGWVARYTAALAEDGHTVVNLAVPGITTFHVLPDDSKPPADRPGPLQDHNLTAALDAQADAVIVNLPSNDSAAGYPAREQLDNYATLVKQAGVPVWIATPQPRDLDEERQTVQAAVLAGVNETFGDRALDFWTGLAAKDGTIDPAYDADGIHLNASGHTILLERVLTADIPADL